MVHGPQSMFYNPKVLPHLQRSRIKAAAAPMEQYSKNSCGARPSEDYDCHAERRTMTFYARLLLFPLSSHGLTTATVSSWVYLLLSSNLSRKFKTLLQESFSWPPVTTTQHLSWKNCTGCPFQNVLSIKSLVCVSVL